MKTIVKYIQGLNLEVEFLIGQNKEDNFKIIDSSEPEDIWFHASNISSCHIIAKMPLGKFDKKQLRYILKQGALLCKQYTNKVAKEKFVEIIYTNVKNVKKTEIIGTVETSGTKVLTI